MVIGVSTPYACCTYSGLVRNRLETGRRPWWGVGRVRVGFPFGGCRSGGRCLRLFPSCSPGNRVCGGCRSRNHRRHLLIRTASYVCSCNHKVSVYVRPTESKTQRFSGGVAAICAADHNTHRSGPQPTAQAADSHTRADYDLGQVIQGKFNISAAPWTSTRARRG